MSEFSREGKRGHVVSWPDLDFRQGGILDRASGPNISKEGAGCREETKR